MSQIVSFNDLFTGAAVLLGLVNLAFLYRRLVHDVALRKAELAMRLVEAEYKRNKDFPPPAGAGVFGPDQLLFVFLKGVDQIYETGQLDYTKYSAWKAKVSREFRQRDKDIQIS